MEPSDDTRLPGAVSIEDTDVCGARSKALLPLTASDEVQSPGFMNDLNCDRSPSSPSEGSRWRRMIRPLANCIACGDFESELSKLKLQKSSTAARLGDCIRKIQEQDSSREVLEKKLQETLSDLDARTAELEAEKRRTSSLSTLLLNDTVKEHKLQEEAKFANEGWEKAQKEIQRLVLSLEKESSDKELVTQELRTKGSEAAGLSDQLEACKQRGTEFSADLAEKTQELKRAQDEIQRISEKLLHSNERLDENDKGLQSLAIALQTAQEENRSKLHQIEKVTMAAEDLLCRFAAAKQHLQCLEEEKEVMAKSLALTTAEKRDLSSRFEKLTINLEDEQSKNTFLEHKMSSLVEEQSVQSAKVRELEEINQRSCLEIKSLAEEKAKIEEERSSEQRDHEATVAQLNTQLSNVSQDLGAKLQESQSATEQLRVVTSSLAEKCQENEALTAELSALQASTALLEQKVLDLDASAKGARSENAALANTLAEKALQLETLAGDLKMEKDQLQTFHRELSVVTTSLEDAVNDKQSVTFMLERLQMEREDLQGQLSRAQGKNAELERALNELASQAAANQEARDAAVQEICSWQINAQLYQSFVEHVSNQRDACLSECREHHRALQDKQREIDVLSLQLRHAEKQENELVHSSLAELTDQLGQSNIRVQMLTASIDLKESEMQVLSRELARRGMQMEDYNGQVTALKEHWNESETAIAQLRHSLGICQSDKDSLQKQLVEKSKLTEEMRFEMNQAKEQLSKSQQETNILDRCLEDKQLQHDLLLQDVGCKESLIENLQCELTAVKVQKSDDARGHEASMNMLKCTLEEQIQQNDQLRLELGRKRAECEETCLQNSSLSVQLTERTLERDDFGAQLQGMRTLIKNLKDELHVVQINENALSEKRDALESERAELQQQNQRLSTLSAQLRRETDRSLAELQRKVDLTEKQRMEIMRLQKELKESTTEVKNLNRCVTLEVRRREEAATRCAELLCSHPSMNIEAWIGKVRASSTKAEWQLVAGSGSAERVVLRGGQETFQPGLTSYETPCIIINHREQRKVSKKRDSDRVAVNIYDAKKPGAVEVSKASRSYTTSRPGTRPIVYDKICKLFNRNALVYDQHFGVVRPVTDDDTIFSPRSSRSSSSRASSGAF